MIGRFWKRKEEAKQITPGLVNELVEALRQRAKSMNRLPADPDLADELRALERKTDDQYNNAYARTAERNLDNAHRLISRQENVEKELLARWKSQVESLKETIDRDRKQYEREIARLTASPIGISLQPAGVSCHVSNCEDAALIGQLITERKMLETQITLLQGRLTEARNAAMQPASSVTPPIDVAQHYDDMGHSDIAADIRDVCAERDAKISLLRKAATWFSSHHSSGIPVPDWIDRAMSGGTRADVESPGEQLKSLSGFEELERKAARWDWCQGNPMTASSIFEHADPDSYASLADQVDEEIEKLKDGSNDD